MLAKNDFTKLCQTGSVHHEYFLLNLLDNTASDIPAVSCRQSSSYYITSPVPSPFLTCPRRTRFLIQAFQGLSFENRGGRVVFDKTTHFVENTCNIWKTHNTTGITSCVIFLIVGSLVGSLIGLLVGPLCDSLWLEFFALAHVFSYLSAHWLSHLFSHLLDHLLLWWLLNHWLSHWADH